VTYIVVLVVALLLRPL